MQSKHGLVALPFLLVAFGCNDQAQESTAGANEPVGVSVRRDATIWPATDARIEYSQISDLRLRDLVRKSSAIIVCADALDTTDPENVVVRGWTGANYSSTITLAERYGLCPSVRFGNQHIGADCSATLIDHDLILTASHCLGCYPTESGCLEPLVGHPCLGGFPNGFRIVFNYALSESGASPVVKVADVFGIQGFPLVQRNNSTNSERLDYAVLRLDRPATPRFQPLAVRRASTSLTTPSFALAGYPSGLPGKADLAGAVDVAGGRGTEGQCTPNCDWFTGVADAFHGNSGGPALLPPYFEVAGILRSGGFSGGDYSQTPAGCYEETTCSLSNPDCDPVQFTFAGRAVDALCQARPSSRVCREEGRLHYVDWLTATLVAIW